MSFCGSCGTDAGQGRFCPSCGAPTANSQPRPTASEMNSGQQPLYRSTPQPAYGSAPWQAPAQPNSAPTSKSLGAAITLLVFSIVGAISTWLPYLTDDYGDSLKGWDSRDPLEYWGEFSAGPVFIIVGTVVSAIIALVIITNQNQAKNSNRVACGVFTLLSGLAVLGAGGATYIALDTALQNEGITANQGIGLWLGSLSGLAITIIGILILALPKATQVR
jgi:hypothetical protein